jgi:TPR repeat protein
LAWNNSQIKQKYSYDELKNRILPLFLKDKLELRLPRRLSAADSVRGSLFFLRKSLLSSRIVEFDIGADGRVRDIEIAKNFYSDRLAISNTIEEMSQLKFQAANKKGNRKQKVRSYGHRSVWAQREITKEYVKRRAPKFYQKIRKLQGSAEQNDPYAQYQIAMLSLAFPALEINTISYVNYIKLSAEAGLPEAQAEYAHLLLSGKAISRDVELAFGYLLRAAQAGYARAQYKLARQFLSESEIIKDEHKAMFWLKQAMAQQEPYAKFWFARLSLKSTDKSLRNAALAKTILASLSKQEEKNPNWYYFSAMAELQLGNRVKGQYFLDEGVELAEEYSWNIKKFGILADKLKGIKDA